MSSKFKVWLDEARGGQFFAYHKGVNLNGCSGTLIGEIRRAYNSGLVELVQKRLSRAETPEGAGIFSYIAVKKRRREAPIPEMRFGARFRT